VAGQRLDQVIGEEAHAAVGADIRTFRGLARTQHGAARACGQGAARRFRGGHEERQRHGVAADRQRIGCALDRHPGRVAAVEHHQQTTRRQLLNIGGKGHRGERAAANASQLEIVGKQEMLAIFDVAVTAEVDDRCRIIGGGSEPFGQPVQPVQDALPSTVRAGEQAHMLGRIGAALRVHQHVAQGTRVGGDGGQRRAGFQVLIDGDQQGIGILEAMAHPSSPCLAKPLRRNRQPLTSHNVSRHSAMLRSIQTLANGTAMTREESSPPKKPRTPGQSLGRGRRRRRPGQGGSGAGRGGQLRRRRQLPDHASASRTAGGQRRRPPPGLSRVAQHAGQPSAAVRQRQRQAGPAGLGVYRAAHRRARRKAPAPGGRRQPPPARHRPAGRSRAPGRLSALEALDREHIWC
jgi:hypothetical protein